MWWQAGQDKMAFWMVKQKEDNQEPLNPKLQVSMDALIIFLIKAQLCLVCAQCCGAGAPIE